MAQIQRAPNQEFLSEGTQRIRGLDAQRLNILVARAVAQAVQSTLGPKGMDKMIVDELGDVTITNDGATILKEMSIDHPAGKMMVEVAKTQDDAVGDGTTTAVVLAGELLHKSEKMLDDQIHASLIVKGYRMAAAKAVELMKGLADNVSFKEANLLKKVALTSMSGKASEARDYLADIVVEAIKQVAEENEIDKEQIKIEKKTGASLAETKLIRGIVIDKERVHSGMPKEVKKARIALVDSALEMKETETDAKISITSPEQLQSFIEQEEAMLRKMVEDVKKAGANVLFCQKGIDDLAQHFLAKEGIFAARRVKKSDMDKLAKATGAKVVTRTEDLTPKDLGAAGQVKEVRIGDEEMTFVEDCKNPKAVTILVRGGSEHIVDEAERALEDAIGTVTASVEDGKIVAGGGSPEIEVSLGLREYAKTIGGREQLAIEAFAEALEVIPRQLARTAGLDPIDALVSLKAAHKGKEGKYMGIDVFKAKNSDMKKANVLEPLRVKTQAITSAAEVSEMILRIDDIIAGQSRPPSPAGMGGMGGMGGMPDMM